MIKIDDHVSSSAMSELLRHLCGRQKSVFCPLPIAYLHSVTAALADFRSHFDAILLYGEGYGVLKEDKDTFSKVA